MGTSDPVQSSVSRQHLGSSLTSGNNDFMILCPVVAENSGAVEALYALFYLPPNFKLLITSVGVKSKELFAHIREVMGIEPLKNRIIVQDKIGMPDEASLFTSANVVVYGSSNPMYTKDAPQAIVVFDIASKMMNANGNHNFAVAASSPESVASAILHVARNQKK